MSDGGMRRVAALMPERDLQVVVVRMCDQLGLWHFAVRDSRGCPPGWPDLTIIGPRHIVYRELKSSAGLLSPAQREVGRRLIQAGGNWAVWKPASLASGDIGRFLHNLSKGHLP